MIRVNVSALVSKSGRPPTGNAIEAALNQCVADAVEGSFDQYPKELQPSLRLKAERLGQAQVVREQNGSRVRFSMGLPAQLFPVERGGLQLLVSLLSGDIFPSETMGCQWSEVEVSEVDLGQDLRQESTAAFRRTRAHDIDGLRSIFQLHPGRPLLAFSLKPRVGLTFAEIREMTLKVLNAGFNVVELDSRHLALNTEVLDRWVALGQEAAATGNHVTAFSPNLSVPSGQMAEVCSRWVDQVGPVGPPVMKVDGGLDGLSSLQSLRTGHQSPATLPIVTTYPMLRNQLASAIGPATWVDLLGLCGADIIYPGGRPTFPNERRPVWGSHVDDWARAARIYDGFLRQGWPMPTIAGGVHPGQLHACYELLGPNVAYFLGGAVALHPKGPEEGAKLCVQVLEQSIQLARDARDSGDDFAEDLPARLLKRVEDVKYPRIALNYFSPANIFSPVESAPESPQTFYRRRL